MLFIDQCRSIPLRISCRYAEPPSYVVIQLPYYCCDAFHSVIHILLLTSCIVCFTFPWPILIEGADELGSALQEADDITKVVLSGNGISSEGVASLCSKLAGTALQSLSITGVERGANAHMSNRVQGKGGKGIAKMLKSKATQLKTLVLSGSNVGDDGLAAVVKGLAGNTVLTALDLHRNQITDAGALLLARALETGGRGLELVIMTANRLTDVGVLALAEAVKAHPSIKVLDCDMNTKVSKEAKATLAAALAAPRGYNGVAHQEL